jgi:hypothetical protein
MRLPSQILEEDGWTNGTLIDERGCRCALGALMSDGFVDLEGVRYARIIPEAREVFGDAKIDALLEVARKWVAENHEHGGVVHRLEPFEIIYMWNDAPYDDDGSAADNSRRVIRTYKELGL